MVLHREPTEGAFEIAVVDIARHAEHFVEIATSHRVNLPQTPVRRPGG